MVHDFKTKHIKSGYLGKVKYICQRSSKRETGSKKGQQFFKKIPSPAKVNQCQNELRYLNCRII